MARNVKGQYRMDDYRLKEVEVRLNLNEDMPLYSTDTIQCDDDAMRVMEEVLSRLNTDWVCVANLNTQLQPINYTIVSEEKMIESPKPVQAVLKSAVLANAPYVMVFQNHENVTASPTTSDKELDDRLLSAARLIGLEVADHIIVNNEASEFSFRRFYQDKYQSHDISLSKLKEVREGKKRVKHDDYLISESDKGRSRVRLKEGQSLYSIKPVNTPQDAVDVLSDMMKEMDREYVVTINMDKNLKPINFNVVAIGSVNESIAPVNNIIKSSILSRSDTMILMHCHPSGSLRPSQEDYTLTHRLLETCKLMDMTLLDHVIVAGGTGRTYSFREHDHDMFENGKKDQKYVELMQKAAEEKEREPVKEDDKEYSVKEEEAFTGAGVKHQSEVRDSICDTPIDVRIKQTTRAVPGDKKETDIER